MVDTLYIHLIEIGLFNLYLSVTKSALLRPSAEPAPHDLHFLFTIAPRAPYAASWSTFDFMFAPLIFLVSSII